MKTTKQAFFKIKGKIFVTRQVTITLYLDRQPNNLHKIGFITNYQHEAEMHNLPKAKAKPHKNNNIPTINICITHKNHIKTHP